MENSQCAHGRASATRKVNSFTISALVSIKLSSKQPPARLTGCGNYRQHLSPVILLATLLFYLLPRRCPREAHQGRGPRDLILG